MAHQLVVLLVDLLGLVVVQATLCDKLLWSNGDAALLLEHVLGDGQRAHLAVGKLKLQKHVEPLVVPGQHVGDDGVGLEEGDLALEHALDGAHRDVGAVLERRAAELARVVVPVVDEERLEHLAHKQRAGKVQVHQVGGV